jgi:hypothetical protein
MTDRASIRRIFPVLVNDLERTILMQLSRERGVTGCALVRSLLLKEAAHCQLSPVRRPAEKVKG